mmetsp:Transcript_8067/g.9225  ORF Transcript_8067/g.9225 Transcript_8067/m.9225 type:complete len:84 (-) Transcript_8067:63-314(-)
MNSTELGFTPPFQSIVLSGKRTITAAVNPTRSVVIPTSGSTRLFFLLAISEDLFFILATFNYKNDNYLYLQQSLIAVCFDSNL